MIVTTPQEIGHGKCWQPSSAKILITRVGVWELRIISKEYRDE